MPNRIIREGILTSERVDAIADDAAVEVFYRRLHSVVDDFGRYSAHPPILRSSLYPLRVNSITESEIESKYLPRCEAAGLITVYVVDGKRYLEVTDFRQQLRAKRSKYPSVSLASSNRTSDAAHPPSTRLASDPHGKPADDVQMQSGRVAHALGVGVGVGGDIYTDATQTRSTCAADATQFTPNVDRFRAEYPLQVNGLEEGLFVSRVNCAGDEEKLFANLAAYKSSARWQDPKYIPRARTWLSEGDWEVAPKNGTSPIADPETPMWRPEDHL